MPIMPLPSVVWTASPNFSGRGGLRVRLVVVHDCEGSYAGSVSWFAMQRSQVSAHVILSEDGLRATQMVHWANKAWHACNVNSFSEGIEAAGFSAKGLGAPEWESLAALTAFRLRANRIPCQRATAANNWTGYCEHWQLGAMGGGHHDITDPVTGEAQRALFDALVVKFYGFDMPGSWGPDRSISAAPPPASPVLAVRTPDPRHGLDVGSLEWVQARLNALHVPTVTLSVDGIMGRATETAVEQFQRSHGLTVDGDPGERTVEALKKAA